MACCDLDPNCGAWWWRDQTNNHGYALYGRGLLAHRLAWEIFRGPIPPLWLGGDGKWRKTCVLHKYEDLGRHNCNPEHLFLGTSFDNGRDMMDKRRHYNLPENKTHCPKGHPYDEDNIYFKRGNTARVCRTCALEARHLSLETPEGKESAKEAVRKYRATPEGQAVYKEAKRRWYQTRGKGLRREAKRKSTQQEV